MPKPGNAKAPFKLHPIPLMLFPPEREEEHNHKIEFICAQPYYQTNDQPKSAFYPWHASWMPFLLAALNQILCCVG
jgi:hypothetical protein